VSLGDRYILSLGAHATHTPLLMDHAAKEPLTLHSSFAACALIAFTLDTPAVPSLLKALKMPPAGLDKSLGEMKRAGIPRVDTYFETLEQVAESIAYLAEMGLRKSELMIRTWPPYRGDDHWLYISWPQSAETWRALTAYWSALLSITFSGRILNFWRAIEASLTPKAGNHLFARLPIIRIQPIRTQMQGPPKYTNINYARHLKRTALARRTELLAAHGTAERSLRWLYTERRGKAAHADVHSLDMEGLTSLGDQVADALLLQYMARGAIEQSWS
jgi:hypothetical protein